MALARVGALGVLHPLYGQVLLAGAVHAEVVVRGLEAGYEDAEAVRAAIEAGQLAVIHVDSRCASRCSQPSKGADEPTASLGAGTWPAAGAASGLMRHNTATDPTRGARATHQLTAVTVRRARRRPDPGWG